MIRKNIACIVLLRIPERMKMCEDRLISSVVLIINRIVVEIDIISQTLDKWNVVKIDLLVSTDVIIVVAYRFDIERKKRKKEKIW